MMKASVIMECSVNKHLNNYFVYPILSVSLRFKASKFQNKVLRENLARLFGELLVDEFAYI
jgi:hypothetical protein